MNQKMESPFTFEITTDKGLRSYCGVLEFTAPEGNYTSDILSSK